MMREMRMYNVLATIQAGAPGGDAGTRDDLL
jgi:hypothetical protein